MSNKVDEKLKKQVIELLMIANGVKEEDFDKEYKVLFICEGHSASSIIRSTRDARVHGVLALRGKIMNVHGKTLSAAMKSDIIKEYLTVMKEEEYDKIIILTDADPDGNHITALTLTCSVKFLNSMVKEGKLYVCETPFYTFEDKKNHKLVGWSNDTADCPDTATAEVNKGLGSYTPDAFKRLALYPQFGAVYDRLVYDKKVNESLTRAMKYGCVDWVKID